MKRVTILLVIALSLMSVLGHAHLAFAASLQVTNTNDSGDGSLRAAITTANADSGDTITFAIGTGAQTINLASSLPHITSSMTIDGSTQPGYSGSPLITINGAGPIWIGEVITATLTGIARTGGVNTAGGAGGFYNLGTLILNQSAVNGNTVAGDGGGIANLGTVKATGTTIEGNSAGGDGGGVFDAVLSSLTLDNSTVGFNSAANGAGVFALGGTVTVNHSVVGLNTTDGTGGAVYSQDASLTITDSTIGPDTAAEGAGLYLGDTSSAHVARSLFEQNGASGNGGAVALRAVARAVIADSTITDNQSGGDGGGIYGGTVGQDATTVTLLNDTISGNTAASGAGIYVPPPSAPYIVNADVSNTILAGNTVTSSSTPADCAGTLTSSAGHNLLGSTAGCTLSGTGTGNIVGQDPLLGDLVDNGGPPQTMALGPGSPAISAGDPSTCLAAPVSDLDQRGTARKTVSRGNQCDIGAYDTQTVLSHPLPTIASVVPVSLQVGPFDSLVTIQGAGFLPSSTVDLVTSLGTLSLAPATQTATMLTLDLPMAQLPAGTALLQVSNPAPGGGRSTPIALFLTADPVPVTASTTSTTGTAAIGGEAGTPGSLSLVTDPGSTIALAQYGADPGPAPTFSTPSTAGNSTYFDAYLAPGSTASSVTILDCNLNGGSLVYWLNGSTWTLASDQQYDPATGCVTVTVTASTSPSLHDLGGTPFAVGMDTTPPSTTATATACAGTTCVPYPFGSWTNQPVTVSLSAGDDGSGVQQTEYTLSNGDTTGGEQTYDPSTGISVGEGVWTLTYWSVDRAGNRENAQSQTIRVDQSAPTAPIATVSPSPAYTDPNGMAWYKDSASVRFGGSTDPALRDGSAGSGNLTYSPAQSFRSTGTHAFSGTATDAAGNTSAATTGSVSVDADPPTIALAAAPGTAPAGVYAATSPVYLLGQSAPVTYTCADVGSGIASCVGTMTDGSTIASGSSLDTSAPGTHTLTVTATDQVGHVVTSTLTYTVAYQVVSLHQQPNGPGEIKLQLQDASGHQVSSAAIPVTAVCIAPVGATSCNRSVVQLNAPFAFTPAKGLGGFYRFHVDASGLQPTTLYQVLVAVGTTPDLLYSIPFTS